MLTFGANLYIALYTTTLTAADSGTEVSGNNYSRVAVTRNTSNWDAPASGVSQNATQINFPIPSASWGTVRAVAIRDASTGGNMLWFANLGSPITINDTTNAPKISVGNLDFQET